MANVSIPEEVLRISRQRALTFYGLLAKSTPANLERGQIWSTHAVFDLANNQHFETDRPRLVVVLNVNGKNLTVVPLSIELPLATEYDLIVSGNDSPLSFNFIIEIWNETPALADQLRQYLTKLPQHVGEWLDELYAVYLLDEEIPSRLLDFVGPPLMGEEDGRQEFQAAEIEAMKYLSHASTAYLLSMAEVSGKERTTRPEFRIELLLPVWRKLSESLTQTGLQVAHATDADVEEHPTWVITISDYPEVEFEMLIRRGRYVYILPHSIENVLKGRLVVFVLNTETVELRSQPMELQIGTEIEIGDLPGFRVDNIISMHMEVV